MYMYNDCFDELCLMNALIKVMIGVTMYVLYVGCYDEHKTRLEYKMQLKPIKFHCINEHT